MVVHASTLYHVDPGNEAVPLATVVAARKHVCQVILIFLLESILEIDTSRKKKMTILNIIKENIFLQT